MYDHIKFGQVTSFYPDLRFGFARTDKGDILFHMDCCCKVNGSPEAPTLTTEPNIETPHFVQDKEIVFGKITWNKKVGLHTTTWGFRPKRNRLDELAYTRELDSYVDGEILILRENIHDKLSSEKAVLLSCVITENRILRLIMKERVLRHGPDDVMVWDAPKEVEHEFDLNGMVSARQIGNTPCKMVIFTQTGEVVTIYFRRHEELKEE